MLDLRRHDPDGQQFGPDAYVFGNEVGERLKNYQKAWSALRLRAIAHGPHWGPNGRFLPCCRAKREDLAEMKQNLRAVATKASQTARIDCRTGFQRGPQSPQESILWALSSVG